MTSPPLMTNIGWIGVAVVLLVAGSGIAGVAAADPGVTAIEYTGENAVANTGDTLHLWQSRQHDFTVVVDATTSTDEVCVRLPGEEPLTCQQFAPTVDDSNRLELNVPTLSSAPAAETTLVFELRNQSTGEVATTRRLPVTVLTVDGDPDGDDLRSIDEVEANTSPVRADTDEDGLSDGVEVQVYDTDPTVADTDGDGLDDGAEVRTHRTNPAVVDTDGDGLSDGIEISRETNPNAVDTDGDGLDDGAEVTTYGTNATRIDTDGDGLTDGAEVQEFGTDPTVADTDGDGLDDGAEIQMYDTDPRAADTDSDGLTDATEVELGTDPTVADTDGDGLDDEAEIEVYGTDPQAADTDSDGLRDGAEVDRGTDPTAPTMRSPGPLATVREVITTPVVVGLGVVGLLAGSAALLHETDGVQERWRALVARLGVGSTDSGGAPDAEAEGEAAPEDMAVLTNEERVTRLLEQNGGRMLQSDMVEAADWSKATVSRVLSSMEDAGAVTRVDVGQGNLVALPEEEPAGAKSPLSNDEG